MRFYPKLKMAMHPQFQDLVDNRKTYPVNVEISPSGICNASCDFCFYANTGELGEHRKEFLDIDVLTSLLIDCKDLGVKSVSWTGGGDPSLYPRIATAVSLVSDLKLQQGMFTNALAKPKFDPSKLEWVRITMTDKPFRVDHIKELRACKTLGFAFNYSGPVDDDYLKTTLSLAEDVKADYVQVRPALRFHGETTDILPPSFTHPLMQVTEYKFEDAKHKHGYTKCEGYHLVPFVWENGNVDVCSYMRKHEGYTLGNLYEDSIKTILDRAPQHVPVHKNCQVCCRNHEHNKAIHEARELQDRNFP